MLRRISISTRLLLLVALPLAGLLGFTGWTIAEQWRARARADATERLTEFAIRAGALVHELQKERGRTSVHLNDGLEASQAAMLGQRSRTDEARGAYDAYARGLDVQRFGARFAARTDSLQGRLADLAGVRKRIDLHEVAPPEAIAWYSRTIGGALDAEGEVTRCASDARSASELAAYVALTRAKESAGLERALASGAYAHGGFPSVDVFNRVVGLGAAQDAWFAQFRALSTTEMGAEFDAVLRGGDVTGADALRAATRAGGPGAALTAVTGPECFKRLTARIDAFKQFEDTVAARLRADAARARDAATRALSLTLLASLLMIGGTLVFGFVTARGIVHPIVAVRDELAEIANGQGDLTRRLPRTSDDEIGQLAGAFNAFIDRLAGILRDVRGAAVGVGGASSELRGAVQHIAAGAQSQASSLEETAACLEQIHSTAQNNAGTVVQAGKLAVEALANAEEGLQVSSRVAEAMSAIQTSAGRIADIVGTIDGLAFQTNLLALNAAVEAARAGEQGRGFAVVASEVRTLATRSADAAREIHGLIGEAVHRVDEGGEHVRRCVDSLQRIADDARRTRSLMNEIETAVNEENTGIGQVNSAVQQMDQVTQANAAQTEELAATAQGLTQHAAQLQETVGRFRLDRAA